MKAKVIKTNKVVEVEFNSVCSGIVYYKSSSGDLFASNDLIFIDSPNCSGINWEQRRFELAKSAMQGILTNMTRGSAFSDYEDRVATQAIQYADAVIAKLKEG